MSDIEAENELPNIAKNNPFMEFEVELSLKTQFLLSNRGPVKKSVQHKRTTVFRNISITENLNLNSRYTIAH